MKYTIEFDTTEIVKLLGMCNLAIRTEQEYLERVPNSSVGETSIEQIKAIKAKIKSVILS